MIERKRRGRGQERGGGGPRDYCTGPSVEGYRGIWGAKNGFCPRNALKMPPDYPPSGMGLI
jgi:hypothetical protein